MGIDIIKQQRDLWNTFSPGWRKWNVFVMEWLQPIGKALIDAVDLQEDDSVLDVATGTGEPGLTAATKVKRGRVVGIDVAEKMVELAKLNAKSRGISNYQARVNSASSLLFSENTFSVILCRFGVMYFADPQADMQELVRVLKTGGKIALSAWAEPLKNPWATTSGKTVMEMLSLPHPDSQAPGIFRHAQPGTLTWLFQQAGLKDVKESEVKGELIFDSPEQYWEYTMDVVAPVTVALSKADASTREKVKQAVLAKARELEKDGKTIFPWSSWVVSGVK